MKCLRRIFFNTLTATSLLLAIATAGLWGISYLRTLYYNEQTTTPFNVGNGWDSSCKLDVTRGQLLLDCGEDVFYDAPNLSMRHREWGMANLPPKVLSTALATQVPFWA